MTNRSLVIVTLIVALLSLSGRADEPKRSESVNIETMLQKAAHYREQGRVLDSEKILTQAEVVAERSPNAAELVLVLGGLSDTDLLRRRPNEALQHAETALSRARESGVADVVLAVALNHYGNALMANGQNQTDEEDQRRLTRKALESYQEGYFLAQQANVPELSSECLINSINAYLAVGDVSEALVKSEAALELLKKLKDSHRKVFSLLALGRLAQGIGQSAPENTSPSLAVAYAALSRALKLAETQDDSRAKSYAMGHLGELYVAMGRTTDARILFQSAIFFGAYSDSPELLARWYWRVGQLLRSEHNTTQAEAMYRKAIEQLSTIQSALVFGYRGNHRLFQEEVRTIYVELAAILINRLSTVTQEPQRQRLLRDVREVMEQFKTVELKHYFLYDDCVTERQQNNADRELDDLIRPGSAVLYPIVFDKRIVLLLSHANGVIKKFETQVRRGELEDTVKEFYKLLRKEEEDDDLTRTKLYGDELYKWLFKDIEEDMVTRGVERLVVVPDGILRTIPFSALFDRDKGEYLVERYAITVTPGLRLTNPEQFSFDDYRVLLSGMTTNTQIPEKNLYYTALSYVKNELVDIAKIYNINISEILKDKTFKKDIVRQRLETKSYAAVSFATHTYIASDPTESSLVAYESEITLDDLEELLRIGYHRNQALDLLVLSACDTAVGDERAALGLAGISVKTGVNSVVASLWPVDDKSTAELITQFFKNLKSSKPKAEALREAQESVLNTRDYRHPYHWAPFVLIGNWR